MEIMNETSDPISHKPGNEAMNNQGHLHNGSGQWYYHTHLNIDALE